MGKLRTDEQKPNRRPTRRDELAQHSEIVWYARGGKFGGSAVEQRVITWGDLFRETKTEVSRGHSNWIENREDERSLMNDDTRQREPMKDRTNEEGLDPVKDAPADDAGRRGMDESRHGEKNGAPQVRTMIEEILDRENIEIAWKKVRSNKGAPGIDGMTIGDFPAFWQKEWPRISRAIMEGNYRPAPVKRAWIPKSDGTKRPIGIPTVLDRVIQQAIAQQLGPIFEIGFSESSHGYRPGRSALVAVAEMESGWKEGRRQIVECDLKSFFDTVNHDRLMEALREKIVCRKTLGLLRRILSAGVVVPDGTLEATAIGVPQGGPMTPRTQKAIFSRAG